MRERTNRRMWLSLHCLGWLTLAQTALIIVLFIRLAKLEQLAVELASGFELMTGGYETVVRVMGRIVELL